ncbi:C-C motif chemokine 1 precursor [Canis lupus familiaris]|uniref:C-C motif chemokine 1 n=1 Tax=Canis lupus familiaris TaxID=9615 RepID=Q68AY8_CANLF|nr:C-C motif chemokine 1 precursor [Canis lupus familiaris]BAD37150.1 CC chemokine ligand 1 [Canis lupus familiaris]|eukprot:NP_001005252.1 C-C motif chemokine 1 precursor [Canis lupus familiaris]
MKLITVALACLLLAGMWLHDVDGRSMHVSSSNCCFNFSEKRIAPQRIRCYKHTSSTCSRRLLILKMKKGRETCVLQTAQWIKDYFKTMKPCLLM